MRRGLTRTLLAAWLGGAGAAAADAPLPPPKPVPAAPAEPDPLPIDLPTAPRLADATHPPVAAARATTNNIQLEVASSYLDLLAATAARAINADTLARAVEMLRLADAADRAGLNKTAADVPRARTEVALRRQEAIDLQGRVAVVSARLAQLL